MTDSPVPGAVPGIADLIAQRYSRRDALRGSATAATLLVGGSLLAACSGSDDDTDTGNPPPTVTATAAPGTVTAGTRVTLTATATDDGSVASTSWVQVSGAAAQLSATTGLTTSFVAPAVGSSNTLVFRFTATDNAGATASADVNVTVNTAALNFTAVAKNRNDLVTVPAGYSVAVLAATGDPLTAATPAYANNGSDTGFAARIGDHGANFAYFGLTPSDAGVDVSNSTRGTLAMNHEGITPAYLHPAGPTAPGGSRPLAEVVKETEAHGVSVVEVAAATTGWGRVQASPLNRRVTPSTAMVLRGPVSGNALLQTAFSPAGTAGRGTIGNAALAQTPYGTALSGEERWARYFRRPASDNARRSAKEQRALARYGVTADEGLYGWATVAGDDTLYRRWDAQATAGAATADFRNEPNQFGWVVEVDPYNPAATVRKRTALGRLAHSGIAPSIFTAGVRPAIYMSDGGENEYLYKFVSQTAWASADAAGGDRMAAGDKYLDTGTLYVARFAADGTGTWVPLTFGTNGLDAANATYSFADQADVLTNARIAGDILAATPMDRPAGMQVSPATGDLHVALVGSNSRTAPNAPNPRIYTDPPAAAVGNRNGHILRLRDTGSLPEATTFSWDIYLFGSGADLDATNVNVSALTADNDFSGAESLRFARPSNPAGLGAAVLFVQTDDTAFRDVTNNQLLAGLSGALGDAATTANTRTITNANGTSQATRIGAAVTAARLKRFLVAPNEAAVTGAETTPDGRTLFVNIQHPGENGTAAAPSSNWPANQAGAAPGARPRSATIVVTRNDGGIIAL
ncbi:hypothetical protein SAMN06297144_1671 [Sphingomonas guangdongensis]|uniref:Phosphatase n=1 Tax=Sphingomonas guangdongensis TaxID=1141890 RepID=A0A285QX60_9SPHN|nr:alkaline phosphatase PhoX [Sphingomonas guangdongensis]SOB86565.1 hypothetical protein SAMN06297144_1671 [Sphingomonas guangdongensis]